MPQLSLYLNDQALVKLKEEAAKEQRSVSSFVSQLIMEYDQRPAWPQGYWDEIYGCLDDASFRVPREMDGSLDGSLPVFSER